MPPIQRYRYSTLRMSSCLGLGLRPRAACVYVPSTTTDCSTERLRRKSQPGKQADRDKTFCEHAGLMWVTGVRAYDE